MSWNPASMVVPFAVQDGDTPVVDMDIEGPVYRAITGYVPSPADVVTEPLLPGDNLVTMPLHYPAVLASDLLTAIPGAIAVGRWEPESQFMLLAGVEEGFDVTIPPGADFHVFMDSVSAWPIPIETVPVGDPGCCTANAGPGCDDPTVQACVCAIDSFCCETAWDDLCADEVASLGCGTCGA